MKKTTLIILTALMTIGTACQKDLELDYGHMTPMLVVEGYVTNEGVSVSVTRTQDMTRPIAEGSIKTAIVTLSCPDGYTEQLELADDGLFHSPTGRRGAEGETYTLRVEQSDTICTAEATMPSTVALDSVRFSWMHMMKDVDIRTCYMYLCDPTDEGDHYQYIWRRRGENFLSGRFNDEAFGPAPQNNMVAFMSRRRSKEAEEQRARGEEVEDEDELLLHGDTVIFELRHIDEQFNRYLRGLSNNTSSAINPPTNIKGHGCIGVFAAFGVSTLEHIYDCDLGEDWQPDE